MGGHRVCQDMDGPGEGEQKCLGHLGDVQM